MSLFSFLFQVRYSRKSSSAVLLWWEKAAMIVTAQVVVVYLNLMIGDSRSHQLNSPRISSESMPEYPIDSHSLAVAATYKKGESHPIYAWNQSVSYISSDDYLIPACDLVLQSSITHSLIKQEFLFFSLQAVEGCSRSRSRTSSMGVAVSCSAVVAGAATWNAEAAAVLGPM